MATTPDITVRIKVSVEMEYDADPENYGTSDPEEMAAIDQQEFDDDPGALFDILGASDFTVTVEPVGENE